MKKRPAAPSKKAETASRRELLERALLEQGELSWREGLALALFSAVVVAVVLHPLLLTSKYFYGSGTDLVVLEYPLREFCYFWWRQGVWPLWNPYLFNGLPLQTGFHPMSYPPLLIGALVGTAREIWIYILMHAWLAVVGMAVLLRWLGHGRAVALVVASGFGLGGFGLNQLYAGHLAIFGCFAYFPWAVLAVLLALRRSGAGFSAATGALLAWVALLGQYQMVHQLVLALLGLTVLTVALGSRYQVLPLSWRRPWTCLQVDRDPECAPGGMLARVAAGQRGRDALHLLARWLLILAVAGALSAFQWLPQLATLEQFNLQRVNWSDWQTTPAHLLSLLVPHLFERTFNAQSWTRWIGWEAGTYLSVPVLLSIGLAWLQPLRQWLLASVLAAGFALLALGGQPLSWYARLDPAVAWFEAPSRFTAAMLIFLCLLAASGLQSTLSDLTLGRRRRWLWLFFGLLLLLVTVLFYADPRSQWWHRLVSSLTTPEEWMDMTTRHRYPERPEALLVATTLRAGLAASLVFVAVVLLSARSVTRNLAPLMLLTLVDLTVAANPYLEVAPEDRFHMEPELARYFSATLGAQRWMPFEILIPPNWSAPAGRACSGGYDLATLKSFDRAVSVQNNYPADTRVLRLASEAPSNLFRLQGTSCYLAARGPDKPLERARLSELQYLGEQVRGAHFYADSRALPRAFLVGGAQVATDQDVLAQIVRDGQVFARTVFLAQAPAGFPASAEPMGAASSVRVLPNQIQIQMPELATPAILVLSDAYFPGWRAELDSSPVEVLRANAGLHRAVLVPPGRHQVRFFFQPLWLGEAIAVSVGSALLLAGWLALTRRRSQPG
ncbi:MAG: hypothetical protein AMXMBFR33_56680 [Candidatus Xenobia bacterium]